MASLVSVLIWPYSAVAASKASVTSLLLKSAAALPVRLRNKGVPCFSQRKADRIQAHGLLRVKGKKDATITANRPPPVLCHILCRTDCMICPDRALT